LVSTRKLVPPLRPEEAVDKVETFVRLFFVFDLTPSVVLEAARGVRDQRFSYYDAQIWAVARLNQVPLILSEDFNSGSTVEGVRFVDPFEEDFDLNDWIAIL
jgi:predicted nucleic acid-binding protein